MLFTARRSLKDATYQSRTVRIGALSDKPHGRFSSSATRCAKRIGSSLCRNCADISKFFSVGWLKKLSMNLRLTPVRATWRAQQQWNMAARFPSFKGTTRRQHLSGARSCNDRYHPQAQPRPSPQASLLRKSAFRHRHSCVKRRQQPSEQGLHLRRPLRAGFVSAVWRILSPGVSAGTKPWGRPGNDEMVLGTSKKQLKQPVPACALPCRPMRLTCTRGRWDGTASSSRPTPLKSLRQRGAGTHVNRRGRPRLGHPGRVLAPLPLNLCGRVPNEWIGCAELSPTTCRLIVLRDLEAPWPPRTAVAGLGVRIL
eukprot:scaffold625_cov420-Prasinococcus_capsulatus_cf.AAC.35